MVPTINCYGPSMGAMGELLCRVFPPPRSPPLGPLGGVRHKCPLHCTSLGDPSAPGDHIKRPSLELRKSLFFQGLSKFVAEALRGVWAEEEAQKRRIDSPPVESDRGEPHKPANDCALPGSWRFGHGKSSLPGVNMLAMNSTFKGQNGKRF